MIDNLTDIAAIAVAFAVFASTARRSRGIRIAAVIVLAIVGWTILVARTITPISVLDTQQPGAICLLATITISAVVIDGRRLPIAIGTVVATAGLLFLIKDRWEPVAAVTLLTAALAAISSSLAQRNSNQLNTADTPSPGRDIVAVLSAAVVAVVACRVFADMASPREFDSEQIARTASLSATGSVLIAIALFLEVAWGQAKHSAPPIVLAGVAFAAVGKEEAVIPAASLAAAILLGPLVSLADEAREKANEIVSHDDRALE